MDNNNSLAKFKRQPKLYIDLPSKGIWYPKDKLEIQVLDDSTDESVDSTASLIETLKKEGFDIQHIRRTNRKGRSESPGPFRANRGSLRW